VEEAQDLTQEFFLRVLEGRYLDRADRVKGRFRSSLLTSLKFFLADERDRSRALKRGGASTLPFEVAAGEDRYRREPAHEETPEAIFERRWAGCVHVWRVTPLAAGLAPGTSQRPRLCL